MHFLGMKGTSIAMLVPFVPKKLWLEELEVFEYTNLYIFSKKRKVASQIRDIWILSNMQISRNFLSFHNTSLNSTPKKKSLHFWKTTPSVYV